MSAKAPTPVPENIQRPKAPSAPPRLRKLTKHTASLLVTPEHENYEVLMRYTCEGMRFKLDEGEFSVTSFDMVGNNLQIWLEDV